jgi:hypothetical protein
MKVVVSFAAESPTIQVIYRDPLIAPDTEMEEEDFVAILPVPVPKFEGIPTTSPWRVAITGLVARSRRRLRRLPLPRMNPLLASAMLFALCSIVCFFLWTRNNAPIMPRTLLSRVEQSDLAVAKSAHPGVIYQKVRISASGHAMERALYRDPERKRRPKQQHLRPADQPLKDQLDIAGVNWDEPLSASNYKEWHDRQFVKQDVVTRAGKNLLTLTTSTGANSRVLSESLTVRENDFHPVERTIELRDTGTIEIAELNYDVMPWGAMNQDWFEPLAGQAMTHPSPAIHASHRVTDLELDLAELETRLALNQLHADSGEQIQVARGADGIEVKGVVDSYSRKHELVSRLSQLSHVRPFILSVKELGSHPQPLSQSTNSQPIQAYSVEAQVSPLEQHLRERQLPTNQLSSISHSLGNGLRIQQAGVHLSELRPRLERANQLSIDLQNQLALLSRDYANTIEAGLDANEQVLLSLGLDRANQAFASLSPDGDLDQQVRHYQQLCLELISSGTGQSRPAVAISEELLNAGVRVRLHAAQMYAAVPKAHD